MQAPNYSDIQKHCHQSHSNGLNPEGKHTGKFTGRKPHAFLRRAAGTAVLALALLTQPVAQMATAATTADKAGHVSQALPSVGAPAANQYFSVTGKSVQGEFLNAFQRFGLSSVGYPLTEERQENGLTVQYFERVRMEYHPETAGKGYPVLMTRLGADLSKSAQPFASIAPFNSTATQAFVKETGHSLAEPFLSYWKGHGGVELFGYPISEPMTQDGMRVQWFERARFEYHPELAGRGQGVQLSLLGEQALQKDTTSPQGSPAAANKVAPPAPVAQPAQTTLTDKEAALLKDINAQRAAAGLPQVQLNAAVTNLARARSNDMAQRNYFSHTTPEGTQFLQMLTDRKFPFKYAGEILARNNYPDGQAESTAMTSYLNSAPHKAIIMDGRYNLVGVGYAKSGEDSMHYFTVIFVQQ